MRLCISPRSTSAQRPKPLRCGAGSATRGEYALCYGNHVFHLRRSYKVKDQLLVLGRACDGMERGTNQAPEEAEERGWHHCQSCLCLLAAATAAHRSRASLKATVPRASVAAAISSSCWDGPAMAMEHGTNQAPEEPEERGWPHSWRHSGSVSRYSK